MNRVYPLGFLIGVLVVGTIAPLAPIQNAYGATVFTSQDREVFVSVQLNADAQAAADQAPDFNPFFGSESVQLSQPGIGEISSFATQDSTLNPNLITANGAAGTAFEISQLVVNNAAGTSSFDVEFELTTLTNYQLTGFVLLEEVLIELGFFDSQATVSLFDVDNNFDIFLVDADLQPGAFADAGLLPPGNYRLSAIAESSAFVSDDPGEGLSNVEYDLSLLLTPVIPPQCSTDVDCDDGDVCNGGETCQAGTCTPGTPLIVDDGVACTVDSCDPINGVTHDDAACFDDGIVGGKTIPIEATSLILAGTQTFSWMIPVVLSALGIGLFVFRRSENP